MADSYSGTDSIAVIPLPAAITVSGANADHTSCPFKGRVVGFSYHVTTGVTTAAAVMTITTTTDSTGSTGSVPVAAADATAYVSLASEVNVDAGDRIIVTSDGGSAAGVVEFNILVAQGNNAL